MIAPEILIEDLPSVPVCFKQLGILPTGCSLSVLNFYYIHFYQTFKQNIYWHKNTYIPLSLATTCLVATLTNIMGCTTWPSYMS